MALENALRKARAVRAAAARAGPMPGRRHARRARGGIYGKPADEREARATLRRCSGATHAVMSGVALCSKDEQRSAALACTEVSFSELERGAVELVPGDAGSGAERAGGYAIQGAGAALVRAIGAITRTSSACRWRPAGPLSRAAERAPLSDSRPRWHVLRADIALQIGWQRCGRRGGPLDCRRTRLPLRALRRGAPAARGRRPSAPRERASLSSTYGHLQLPDRFRWPRHGGRPGDRQHARLRARPRDRAVGAERRGDRLAHRRGARGRDRGQADARPHTRARSRRSGR